MKRAILLLVLVVVSAMLSGCATPLSQIRQDHAQNHAQMARVKASDKCFRHRGWSNVQKLACTTKVTATMPAVSELAKQDKAQAQLELPCYRDHVADGALNACILAADAQAPATTGLAKLNKANTEAVSLCFNKYPHASGHFDDHDFPKLDDCVKQANANHPFHWPAIPAYQPVIYPSDITVSTFSTLGGADTFVVTPWGTSVYHVFIQP